MSTHPHVRIVFGIEIQCASVVVSKPTKKFDVDTGIPYFVPATDVVVDRPKWLELLWEAAQDSCGHDDDPNQFGIFYDESGEVFLVGKLIKSFDVVDCYAPVVLPALYDSDRTAVRRWLQSVGAENVDIQDIQLRIDMIWD